MANEKVLVSKKLLNNLANKFKTLTGKNKTFTIQEMIDSEVKLEGVDSLKKLINARQSSAYLFYGCKGDNLNELIKYSDTENSTSFTYMFRDCENATTFPQIDTSNGIKFNSMYANCTKAISFPQIDTSKGTNFGNMYQNCSVATTFPQIDTSNGTKFSQMYIGCSKATSFPRLNTDLGSEFDNMFKGCYKVIKVDISKFTSSSTGNSSSFCNSCYLLKALIIRSFGETYILNSNSFGNCYWLLGTQNNTYNPNGEQGYIYVPRDMITTLSQSTNWSTLQFRALEDYTVDGTTTGEFDDEKAGI